MLHCGVDEFLAGAEKDFSPELGAKAGKYLDDGRGVDYATWLSAPRGLVQIIDVEKDAPTQRSATYAGVARRCPPDDAHDR